MPITEADVLFLRSATGTSDGGAESATEIVSGVHENLWPNLSDALRASGGTRYKKFYVKNDSGTETASEPSVWIAESPASTTVHIGLGAPTADDASSDAGVLSAWTANAKVSLTSSAADTRVATIIGLNTAGDAVTEDVTLTGVTEVLSVNTYSKVWCVYLSTLHATLVVTIKQGSGGSSRGTVNANRIIAFLWVLAPDKASGIKVPDLLPGDSIPVWCRHTWSAGISAQRPTRQIPAFEENA